MNCPNCRKTISIKKNQVLYCRCGAKLLATLIKGKLEVFNLSKEVK